MGLEDYRAFIKDTRLEVYDELLDYIIELGNGGGINTDTMITLIKIEKYLHELKNKLIETKKL